MTGRILDRTEWGLYRLAGNREISLRCAIVGGTGLIGSTLAEVLRGRGDEVSIVTRRTPREDSEVRWDPSRGVLTPARLEDLDVVFNLIGAPLAERPWTKQRRKVLHESRIEATGVLIRALAELERPPRVFVGTGGLGIFGDRGVDVIDDDDPPGRGFLAELCAGWEAAHLTAEAELGARAAVLRMSVVLSARGGAFPLMVKPFRYVGGWVGNGRQYTAWISMRDCVRALIHLAESADARGSFNGTVPHPVVNKEWCRSLGRAMRRPVMTHAPKWALRGALGDLADELFLASVRAVPRKLLSSGFEFVDTDAEATFRLLLAEM